MVFFLALYTLVPLGRLQTKKSLTSYQKLAFMLNETKTKAKHKHKKIEEGLRLYTTCRPNFFTLR